MPQSKQQARLAKLNCLKNETCTLVFYESTHRIIDSLDDIATCYGEECELVLAKELTKTFERFISGTSQEIKDWLLSESAHCKGEFVLIVPPRPIQNNAGEKEQILSILLEELPLKQAVSLACKLTQGNKNELYELALSLKNK